jgi:predicted HicB family RNase H-like nuclease
MGTMPRRPHVATMIRFPPELHARLVALAEMDHRSLSAQIIHVMEEWATQKERELRERQEQRAQQEGEPPA